MKILNNSQCKKFLDLAIERLKKYIIENNLKGITTGISGGIDSAIVVLIGVQSINQLNTQGYRASFKYYYLDCQSAHQDLIKTKTLAERFNFKLNIVDLNHWFKQSPLLNLIPKDHQKARIAQGNIKARLRMISLYQVALLNNYIYLDTGDFSEKLVGFWTRHGDEGDLKIINQVTKTELYDLGEYLQIPKIILDSKPGDGLNVTKNNKTIDQLGLDYIYIEYIISRFVEQGFDYNGSFKQLNLNKFIELEKIIAKEINKPLNMIKKILDQTLQTAYKRKYGDYSLNLLPQRKEFNFLDFGKKKFNHTYLSAIIS